MNRPHHSRFFSLFSSKTRMEVRRIHTPMHSTSPHLIEHPHSNPTQTTSSSTFQRRHLNVPLLLVNRRRWLIRQGLVTAAIAPGPWFYEDSCAHPQPHALSYTLSHALSHTDCQPHSFPHTLSLALPNRISMVEDIKRWWAVT